MFVLTNAIANLLRNKGRNFILGLIILFILFLSAISIAIYTASNELIDKNRLLYSSAVVLTRNNELLPENPDEYREPNLDDYIEMAKSKLLKKAEIVSSVTVSLQNGKAIDENTMTNSGITGEGEASDYKMATNLLYGINNAEINNEFISGKKKIIKGNVYKNKNEAVISKALAQLNKWDIGDKFVVNVSSISTEKISLTLTISGIYEDETNEYSTNEDMQMALTNKRNEMFVSMDTLSDPLKNQLAVSANFTISDSDDLKKLNDEFHELGLPNYFEVKADDATFKKIVAPVEGLSNIALLFAVAVFIAGALILIVISNIAIRERKYEIGVLRAMGMKKGKIAFGLFSEVMVISLLCAIIGLSLAAFSVNPVSEFLYETQSDRSYENETTNDIDFSNFAASANANDIEVRIDGVVIIDIFIMSIVLTGLSSMIGIIYVMRYEPLKILSERD